MLPFAARCLLAGALTLFFVSGGALANTEIVNFAAADSADLSPALLTLTANWYVILVSCMMVPAHVQSIVQDSPLRACAREAVAYTASTARHAPR